MRTPFNALVRERKGLIALVILMLAVLFLGYWLTHPVSVREPVGGSVQDADQSIAQESERPSSELTTISPSIQDEPLVDGCSLRFSFEPSAKSVRPGGEVVYTATLANLGREICQNVSFSVYYSENESFVSASPGATSGGYYWIVGPLASRQQFSTTIRTVASGGEGAEIHSEACATADNGTDVCPSNTLFVSSNAALTHAIIPPNLSLTIPQPTMLPLLSGKELGTWIWDPPTKMAPGYVKEALDAAKRHGFNAVYLTIDDYLDKPESERQTYMRTLSEFVTLAKARGIAVDAEGGGRDWAQPENRWKGYALINFVKDYNAAYPNAKLRGFQYDVEPYLLPSYEDNKTETLKEFVLYIEESAARLRNSGITFSIVIPHFYDAEQRWTPAFTLHGREAHAFTHLLQALNENPGSMIIIMSYRNFFEGDNGTRQISEAELREAAAINAPVRIIVAQEVGNVDPAYVTFHGLGKDALKTALTEIGSTFKEQSKYGGAAVHYLDPFLAL